MAYTPYEEQNWDTTSYVNPTRMNHMENGIKSNSDGINALNSSLSQLGTYVNATNSTKEEGTEARWHQDITLNKKGTWLAFVRVRVYGGTDPNPFLLYAWKPDISTGDAEYSNYTTNYAWCTFVLPMYVTQDNQTVRISIRSGDATVTAGNIRTDAVFVG